MTATTSWRMRGDILEACSCNIVCPCNYGGDATKLPCEALLGFRIQEGNYGNTQLGGLNIVLYVQIPGKVFDGGWTLGVYLDERASPGQVEALGTILSGQAGGWFEPFSGLIANPLDPKQVSINFELLTFSLCSRSCKSFRACCNRSRSRSARPRISSLIRFKSIR